MSLLTACATVNSEPVARICPLVVEYDAGVQVRAAEEVQELPGGSAVVEMLNDYAGTGAGVPKLVVWILTPDLRRAPGSAYQAPHFIFCR